MLVSLCLAGLLLISASSGQLARRSYGQFPQRSNARPLRQVRQASHATSSRPSFFQRLGQSVRNQFQRFGQAFQGARSRVARTVSQTRDVLSRATSNVQSRFLHGASSMRQILRGNGRTYAQPRLQNVFQPVGPQPRQQQRPYSPQQAQQSPRQSNDVPSSRSARGWSYDQFVAGLISSKMRSANPGDLCPRYSDAISTQFWTGLFRATANAESGYNPNNDYAEKFKANNGSRQVSSGLLQLSLDDKSRGGACSAMTSSAAIHNGQTNLACGARIMDALIGSRDSLRASLGRYWSTIRDGKINSQLRREVPQCY
jgi:hypothetical protein